MKHFQKDSEAPLTPQRQRQPQADEARRATQSPERRSSSYIGTLVVAAALIGLTGWGLSALFGARHSDQVSDQERTQRAATLNLVKAVSLPAVKPSEWSAALDSMKLSQSDRTALLKDVSLPATGDKTASAADPSVRQQPLVWVTLWDTHAQDGDVVMVQSGGYKQEVTLLNKPTRFAVPLPASGALSIIGMHDGGGGITIGAMSGDIPIGLPIMSEGQTINVPVAVR